MAWMGVEGDNRAIGRLRICRQLSRISSSGLCVRAPIAPICLTHACRLAGPSSTSLGARCRRKAWTFGGHDVMRSSLGAFRTRVRVACDVTSLAITRMRHSRRISPGWSLSFIGGVSAHEAGSAPDANAETPSITRLEGSRWRKRAGAVPLWS